MSSEISAQAQGWLKFFAANPDIRVNYLALMELGVSRRRSRDIIRELKDADYLKITRLAGGGSNLKVVRSKGTTVVRPDYSYTASKQIYPYGYTASKVNNATNKFLDEVEEEEITVGYDFFESTPSSDDDLVRERKKHMDQKKSEYEEARVAKAQQRKDMHRSKVNPASWSCKDVAYEFADRMANIWSIKPFSVTQSRFVQALAVFRKQHDTDGAVELQIIELFFATLKQDKYTDGNHLWRAFLYKAPSLVQVAREGIVTAEEREHNVIRDQELAERKLSMFDED
jgi:hypothetical protein